MKWKIVLFNYSKALLECGKHPWPMPQSFCNRYGEPLKDMFAEFQMYILLWFLRDKPSVFALGHR